jgi:hypothetical protein
MNLHPLLRINWRASLVPAAAVIPAPIAYIKVVAVKKLVVGFLVGRGCRLDAAQRWLTILLLTCLVVSRRAGAQIFYLEKIRVFQAG